MDKMKAIIFLGPRSIQVMHVPKPVPPEGWTRIRVSHVGICGADISIYSGEHPRAKAPLIMGHEFSGWIDSPHPTLPMGTLVSVYPYLSCGECERCVNGARHVCRSIGLLGIDTDGGMAEYAIAPNDQIIVMPENMAPELAAFLEPVGISVHVARHGGYIPGESALVFGAGGIGLSCSLTLRRFGAAHVMVCETNPARRALAESLGFDVLDNAKDIVQQVYNRTNGLGAQHVFDCAGVQPVLDLLPEVTKIDGNIVIVAGYMKPSIVELRNGMYRELTVRFVRNCTPEEFAIARNLLNMDPGYAELLNCILPMEEAQKGFDRPAGAYKVLLKVH